VNLALDGTLVFCQSKAVFSRSKFELIDASERNHACVSLSHPRNCFWTTYFFFEPRTLLSAIRATDQEIWSSGRSRYVSHVDFDFDILAFTNLQGLKILMLKNPTSASGVKVLFNHRTFLAYPWGPSQVAVVSLAAATRRWTWKYLKRPDSSTILQFHGVQPMFSADVLSQSARSTSWFGEVTWIARQIHGFSVPKHSSLKVLLGLCLSGQKVGSSSFTSTFRTVAFWCWIFLVILIY